MKDERNFYFRSEERSDFLDEEMRNGVTNGCADMRKVETKSGGSVRNKVTNGRVIFSMQGDFPPRSVVGKCMCKVRDERC